MEVKVWSPNHWTTQGITMFRFLTQSELCVLYGVRSGPILHVVIQFYQHYLLKRLSFANYVFLAPLL